MQKTKNQHYEQIQDLKTKKQINEEIKKLQKEYKNNITCTIVGNNKNQ
mgnify:CR=1 FL=1